MWGVRAEVWRCPLQDCVVMWEDGDSAGWKGCPLRGFLYSEPLTGGAAVDWSQSGGWR